jgi:hypothetical protein
MESGGVLAPDVVLTLMLDFLGERVISLNPLFPPFLPLLFQTRSYLKSYVHTSGPRPFVRLFTAP